MASQNRWKAGRPTLAKNTEASAAQGLTAGVITMDLQVIFQETAQTAPGL